MILAWARATVNELCDRDHIRNLSNLGATLLAMGVRDPPRRVGGLAPQAGDELHFSPIDSEMSSVDRSLTDAPEDAAGPVAASAETCRDGGGEAFRPALRGPVRGTVHGKLLTQFGWLRPEIEGPRVCRSPESRPQLPRRRRLAKRAGNFPRPLPPCPRMPGCPAVRKRNFARGSGKGKGPGPRKTFCGKDPRTSPADGLIRSSRKCGLGPKLFPNHFLPGRSGCPHHADDLR